MANYKVGTNLAEGTPLSPIEGVTTGVVGIVGTFERGPLNKATLVTSFAQFQSIFGTKPAAGSTSWYSVKAFFAKAGTGQLYVVRAASSSANKATHTFDDQQGAPANTLKVEAANEGTWGNDLSVDVDAYNILSTTVAADVSAGAQSAVLTSVEGLEVGSYVEFDNTTNQEQVTVTAINASTNTINWSGALTNAYSVAAGSTAKSLEFKLTVYSKGIEIESWSGLSMNDAVSFHVEKAVNSNYITCTDLKASDTDYQDNPVATSAAAALTTGADGLTDVVGTDYSGSQANKTGFYAFDDVEALFRFAVPNPILTDAVVATAYQALVQAGLDYANARVTCQFYADVLYGKTPTEAVTFAANFAGRRVALFYPWLKVVESGVTIWLPPSSFALGVAVEKDYRRGVHKSLGNETLAYAIDVKYAVSRAEGETLNDAGVNTIRKFTGAGIKTYGARTLSTTTAFRFLDASEYWNYIGRSLEKATQDVPFEINDEVLWKGTERRIGEFLSNEQRKRALFDASNPGGQAWSVVMNSQNNPSAQVALGIAAVDVTYVKSGTAEKFVITLTPSPSGLSVA